MKIMSMIRVLCLLPFILVYGVWLLFKFVLGLSVLFLAAWLIHALFGKAGDIALALPVIYGLTFLIPNLRLRNFGQFFKHTVKTKTHQTSLDKSKVIELKNFQRKV